MNQIAITLNILIMNLMTNIPIAMTTNHPNIETNYRNLAAHICSHRDLIEFPIDSYYLSKRNRFEPNTISNRNNNLPSHRNKNSKHFHHTTVFPLATNRPLLYHSYDKCRKLPNAFSIAIYQSIYESVCSMQHSVNHFSDSDIVYDTQYNYKDHDIHFNRDLFLINSSAE